MPRTPLPPKLCEQCQAPYIPTRAWQKYCSDNCRLIVFYNRQAARNPLDRLTLPSGPTPLQEAEWKRREEEAAQRSAARSTEAQELYERERREEIARAKELARHIEVNEQNKLEDIIFGKDEKGEDE